MRMLCRISFLLLALVAMAEAEGATPRLTVVFRMDDYSARSSFEVERQIIEQFRARHFPLTVAAIPAVAPDPYSEHAQPVFPLHGERAAYLRQAALEGTVDIIQHGFTHQDMHGAAGSRMRAEFRGTSYEVQVSRIATGKRILEQAVGLPIQTFCPPYNTQDLDTFRALEQNGFMRFSSGLYDTEATPGKPFPSSKILVLPSTTSLRGLPAAVDAARQLGDDDAVIVVLFHSYELAESGDTIHRGPVITLAQVASLLDWVKQQPDVRVVSLDDAFALLPDLSVARFNANRPSFVDSIAPAFVQRLGHATRPRGVYLSSAYQARRQVRAWAVLIAFCVTNVLLFLGLLLLAWKARWLNRWTWRAGGLGSALALALVVSHTSSVGYLHYPALAVSLLACTFLLCWLASGRLAAARGPSEAVAITIDPCADGFGWARGGKR